MPNPFTVQAKKKSKLRAFGAAAPKKQSVNGKTAKVSVNPWTAKANNSVAAQLKQLEAEIEAVGHDYEQAFIIEAKKFAALDKLDTRGKRGTDAYSQKRAEWDSAWRKLDALANKLHGLARTQRSLAR